MPNAVIVLLKISAIILMFIITTSFIASILFNRKVKKEVRELFNCYIENRNQIEVVQKGDLDGLPLCVQKWLEYSQVIGKEKIRTVRSRQKAIMRMKEKKSWLPVKAEQYFIVDEPGFIWKAKIKAAPFLHIAGRDKYYKGLGNMLIKLLSMVTVADSKGKEMDQGTLIRYLAETVWFPTAALSTYIKWEEVESNSAKATMNYKGVTGSGVFIFNEKGEVINFVAERYGEFDGKYVMETWSVPMKDYKEFCGVKVPTKGEVIWKLKTGDFSWYHFEVMEIEYNKPIVY